MYPQFLYILVVFFSAAISAVLGGIALRYQRQTRAVIFFSPMMFMISEWQVASIFVCLSRGDEITMLWITVRYIGLMLMVPFFMAFALQYTGQENWTTRKRLPFLFIMPIVSIIVTCTNSLHHWMIRDIHYSMDGPLLYVDSVRYGWYFWVHSAYSYLLVLIASILIVKMALNSYHLYRRQAIMLMLGVIPGVGASIMDAFMLLPQFKQAVSPLGFALTGVVFFESIYRRQLFNVVPIARDMLIENMSDGMLVLNEAGQIVDINPTAETLLGVHSTDIIGRPMMSALARWRSLIDYCNQDISQGEVAVQGAGMTRCYDLRISPILDRSARLIGRLVLLRDITERKKMEEELRRGNEKLTEQLDEINNLHSQLQEQVIRDPLTGLYNRRYLNDMLQHMIAYATRKRSPLSILMIDIDHFKNINDAYGHAAGDDVLISLSKILTANVRTSDMIYRYGGEEFLILMQDTSLETARQRAEMIRASVEKSSFTVDKKMVTMTVSIGVATFPADGRDLWEVIDAADNALYEAKANGRNRVECTVGVGERGSADDALGRGIQA